MRGSYFYLRSTPLVLYSVRFGVLIVFLFMSPLQPYTRVYWEVYATLTASIKMAKQDKEIIKKNVRIIRVVLRNSCQWSNIFSRFISVNDTEKVIDWVWHLFLSSVKLPLIYQPLITFTIAILSEKIQGQVAVRLLLIIQHSIAVYGPILGMVFLVFTTNCHLSSSYEDSRVRYLLVPFYR